MKDEMKSIYVYAQPLPMRSVHSRLTTKLGPIRLRVHCQKTQISIPKYKSPFKNTVNFPRKCAKQQNKEQFSYFHNPESTYCNFNLKFFRQRGENLIHKRKETSISQGLPTLDSKSLNKTTILSSKTRPNITTCIYDFEQTQQCEQQLKPKHSHRPIFNGKVLTLDITKLQKHQEVYTPSYKYRQNTENVVFRLDTLRKNRIKTQFRSVNRQVTVNQDFKLKPWEEEDDNEF